MKIDTIFAYLIDEPFCFSFSDIRKMTLYQIYRIVFHPRTDKGEIIQFRVEDAEENDKDRADYIKARRKEGFTLKEAETLYDEYFRVEGFKHMLRAQGTTIQRETREGKSAGSTTTVSEKDLEQKAREYAAQLRKQRPFMMR